MILTSDLKSMMQAVMKALKHVHRKEQKRILKILAQHRITAKIKFRPSGATLTWEFPTELEDKLFAFPRAAHDPTPGVVGVVQVYDSDRSIVNNMQVFEVDGKLEVRTMSGEIVDMPNMDLLRYAVDNATTVEFGQNRSS